MRQEISVSVILPVLNEADNLSWLIPTLYSSLKKYEFEVIVIDDNSTDNTSYVVNNLISTFPSIRYYIRSGESSLTKSILEGMLASKMEFVAWMDADGSMPISELVSFIGIVESANEVDAVIGSRFVVGGGFKGMNPKNKTSARDFIKNVYNSNDSISAIFLSRLLNLYLRLTVGTGVKDLTSGFIVIKRNKLEIEDFRGSYGEYFPRLVYQLKKRNLNVKEKGYICLPRVLGESKTGSNLFQLITRGLPYIITGNSILVNRARSKISHAWASND